MLLVCFVELFEHDQIRRCQLNVADVLGTPGEFQQLR
jgi:hypothetical protein